MTAARATIDAAPSAGSEWPASSAALDAGRALLRAAAPGRVAIGCDHDVDGLASATLLARAVERMQGTAIIEPVARGEHAHVASFRDRLAAHRADAYAITDMGSRATPIGLPGPTLLLDHHDADAFPPDAVVVSAARRRPVAPTSYLAFELVRPLASIDDLAWLALLGSVADLGAEARFGALPDWRKRWRVKDVTEAIALLNAARRAPDHDVATALAVLLAARSPADVAEGRVPGVDALRAMRAEVAAEVARVARVPPRVVGEVALIRIASRAQIHPLVAVRWKTRLAGKIVLVANEGFVPGRVHFVVRSTRDVDLLAWLRGLDLGDVGPELARGHPAATGGSLSDVDFARLIAVLEKRAAPGGTARSAGAVPVTPR